MSVDVEVQLVEADQPTADRVIKLAGEMLPTVTPLVDGPIRFFWLTFSTRDEAEAFVKILKEADIPGLNEVRIL